MLVLSSKARAVESGELAGLFFLQSLAAGTWLVTLGSVLEVHGLAGVRPYAYATTAVAAFVSPLLFGAMADRHTSPVRHCQERTREALRTYSEPSKP
jgi:hypothetical protein